MIAKKRRFKKEDSSDSKFLPIVLGLLFLAIIGFLVVSNVRINKKRTELQSQIKSLQSQIQALEEKKAALQAGISQGQSEGFVEKEAREKLGLKKPGEEVVVVMPPEENQTTSAQQNKSLWQKFLQFLHLRD